MIALSNYNNLTPEEYLQFEEKSPIKHEYIDGQVYPLNMNISMDKFTPWQGRPILIILSDLISLLSHLR